jgi:predicted transcriptional regulator
MAPTTTLRVPVDLRDEIARLAEERGTTMLEVVADAIHRLTRDEWWADVHDALDGLQPEEAEGYRQEADRLDGAAADGLDGG